MTTLTKPVTRAVTSWHNGDLVVTLTNEGIYFREKDRRTKYLLPYSVGYFKAARLEADRRVRATRENRAARQRARRAQ